jgi:hypothetical protein
MPRMSKIDLFAAIRRDACAGMSGRAIELKYRVGRRPVSAAWRRRYRRGKAKPPRGSKLDPFKPVIGEILRADLDAPRKQRHTVRRIYRRLFDGRREPPAKSGDAATLTDFVRRGGQPSATCNRPILIKH